MTATAIIQSLTFAACTLWIGYAIWLLRAEYARQAIDRAGKLTDPAICPSCDIRADLPNDRFCPKCHAAVCRERDIRR